VKSRVGVWKITWDQLASIQSETSDMHPEKHVGKDYADPRFRA
jgi:hypothetical protein